MLKNDVYNKNDDNITDTKWMIINMSQLFQYDLILVISFDPDNF